MGYTPTHYGPNAVDEATEFKRQLEDSGLFKVDLKSTEWEQYQTIYKEGAYDLWMLGWFPDYPDADDYLSPFLVDGGFFQNGYQNDEVNDAGRARAGVARPGRARTTTSRSSRTSPRATCRSSRAGSATTPPSTRTGWRASRRPSTRRTSSGSGRSPRAASTVFERLGRGRRDPSPVCCEEPRRVVRPAERATPTSVCRRSV